MATPVGGDTPIRRVTARPREPETPVRCLGIDDFAFRKGQHYGTIPIDLERGRVVDLLKSRYAADVEARLKAHPGVETSPATGLRSMPSPQRTGHPRQCRSRTAGTS